MVLSRAMGASVRRKEDPRLITGRATYTDDLRLVDMAFMVVVRSPHAHARIRGIDTRKALDFPGVLAVLTGADVKDLVGPLRVDIEVDHKRHVPPRPLAVDKVRYVGDPVAAVVATDRYRVRDAVEMVQVDYEELSPVLDPEKALAPGAPRLHDHLPDNMAYELSASFGDVDRAFLEADGAVSLRMVNQRVIPAAMEARAVVAHYQPGPGTLTVWSATQVPHILRSHLASMLKLPENRVRVVAPEVGGGFGSKLNVYAEEVLAAILTMRLGRPVKWVEERQENFVATIHGRDQVQEVEAAYRKDGTVTGLRLNLVANVGAYMQLATAAIPAITPGIATGCYRIPNYGYRLRAVYTNKTATDFYRGAGRPEATYIIERVMDRVAVELGMDPAAVRRRNFIPAAAFPYKTASGLEYDSGNYQAALDQALGLADYRALRQEQRRLRSQRRPAKLMGIGLATYVEICGMGPSSMLPWGGWESATVEMTREGRVRVLTGVSPHGQGEETSFAQIVAQELGVPLEDVVVLHGDTDVVHEGTGTFGSRSMAVGGPAVLRASQKVREKALRIAANLLDVAPEHLAFEGGCFSHIDIPGRTVAIQEVARQAYRATRLPERGWSPA